ncbi:MAG TPA: DUF3301 domain-containing protein [Burkholderiales bacterium]|jgi:hypothetical protein|nr:DUF3301 domain-containing protein [Burkholderiales bacterium]
MIELAALLLFLVAGWFWLDSLRARDVALDGARRACEAEGVQLLDWTVALRRIRLGRDEEGRRGFQRTYEFEFSDTGNNRIGGSITVLGRQLLSLNLPVVAPTSNVIRLH